MNLISNSTFQLRSEHKTNQCATHVLRSARIWVWYYIWLLRSRQEMECFYNIETNWFIVTILDGKKSFRLFRYILCVLRMFIVCHYNRNEHVVVIQKDEIKSTSQNIVIYNNDKNSSVCIYPIHNVCITPHMLYSVWIFDINLSCSVTVNELYSKLTGVWYTQIFY